MSKDLPQNTGSDGANPLSVKATEVAETAVEASASEFKVGGDARLHEGALLEAVQWFGLPVADFSADNVAAEKSDGKAPHSPLMDDDGKLNTQGELYLKARAEIIKEFKKNPADTSKAVNDAISAVCAKKSSDDKFEKILIDLKTKQEAKARVISNVKVFNLQDSGLAKEYQASDKKGMLGGMFSSEYSSKAGNETGPDADVTPSWDESGTKFTMVLRNSKDGKYFAKQILEKNGNDTTARYTFTLPEKTFRYGSNPKQNTINWGGVKGTLKEAQRQNCYTFTAKRGDVKLKTIDQFLDLPNHLKGVNEVAGGPLLSSTTYITRPSDIEVSDITSAKERMAAGAIKAIGDTRNPNFKAYQETVARVYLNQVYDSVITEKLADTQSATWGSEKSFNPRDPVALHTEMIQKVSGPAEERIKDLEGKLANPNNTASESKDLRAKIAETRVVREEAKATLKRDLKNKPELAAAVYQNFSDMKVRIDADINALKRKEESSESDLNVLNKEIKELKEQLDTPGVDTTTINQIIKGKELAIADIKNIPKVIEAKEVEKEKITKHLGDAKEGMFSKKPDSDLQVKQGKLGIKLAAAPTPEVLASRLRGDDAGLEVLGNIAADFVGTSKIYSTAPSASVEKYREKTKDQFLAEIKDNSPKITEAQVRSAAINKLKKEDPRRKSPGAYASFMKRTGQSDISEEQQQEIDQVRAAFKEMIDSPEFAAQIKKDFQEQTAAKEALYEYKAEQFTRAHMSDPKTREALENFYKQDELNAQVTEIYFDAEDEKSKALAKSEEKLGKLSIAENTKLSELNDVKSKQEKDIKAAKATGTPEEQKSKQKEIKAAAKTEIDALNAEIKEIKSEMVKEKESVESKIKGIESNITNKVDDIASAGLDVGKAHEVAKQKSSGYADNKAEARALNTAQRNAATDNLNGSEKSFVKESALLPLKVEHSVSKISGAEYPDSIAKSSEAKGMASNNAGLTQVRLQV